MFKILDEVNKYKNSLSYCMLARVEEIYDRYRKYKFTFRRAKRL
ncbi:hypothetical protein CNEO3_1210008 [Clostridium neonatale]|uniref:Uncharacterized protein n=1 Tax=Clostridium neonatale TaxID=137838 RepID=A0AA86MPD8_9CLOT|nr:hypothetical protein CNEO_43066 [Clostridium neonatale]CAI3195268.1 hypothetical protein CNEO2_180060 [Clostridium neonatale]CAI3562127.1 hypothetical protein CNEO4_110012 [Clostridium neonatale]CAI3569470.1 hypothetical protein CNEO3_1210008 [Clostridium neonatale]CAI3630726.1 hypothetical protein CNEO3_1230008 [Clostridium neonatale]